MMRKLIACLMLALLCRLELSSQATMCSTPGNVPDFITSNHIDQSQFSTALTNKFLVRTRFILIRRSNGTGGYTAADVPFFMNTLNSDFNPHNICFALHEISYIDNDTYFNSGLNSSVFSVNNVANCLNVYLLGSSPPGSDGLAQNIGANALYVQGLWNYDPSNTCTDVELAKTAVLSHEVGHCFGLYHTFESYFCAETPSGSNCSTCGDLICDTPADPGSFNFNVNCSSCTWVPSTAPYAPDPKNLMSYSQPTCMDYFTSGQGTRMRTYLATNPVCTVYVVPNDGYFQAVSYIGNLNYFVLNSIRCGSNVTTTLPNAPVTFGSNGAYNLKANEYISLQYGTVITPASGGYFFAEIRDACGLPTTVNNAKVAGSSFSDPEETPRVPGKLNVFPNPSTGNFTLQFKDEDAKTVLVTDITGRIILQQTLGGGSMQLDLSGEKNGIYFIHVNNASGGESCKVIKQN